VPSDTLHIHLGCVRIIISVPVAHLLAIPRIPTKRRLPSQSLGSILSDLEALVDQCAPLVSRPIGLNIIRSTSRLAKDIISWVEEGAKREPTDVDASKVCPPSLVSGLQ
jgi:hypothetical protein